MLVYTVEFFLPLQLEPTVTKWFQESSRIGNVHVNVMQLFCNRYLRTDHLCIINSKFLEQLSCVLTH